MTQAYDPVWYVCRTMVERGLRAVPVVVGFRRLVGIVTRCDLMG